MPETVDFTGIFKGKKVLLPFFLLCIGINVGEKNSFTQSDIAQKIYIFFWKLCCVSNIDSYLIIILDGFNSQRGANPLSSS